MKILLLKNQCFHYFITKIHYGLQIQTRLYGPLIEPSNNATINQPNSLLAFQFQKPLFFFLNWRIITLQCCGSLCHTSMLISHNCICVYMYMYVYIYTHRLPLEPPTPIPPLQVITEGQLGSLSCIATSHQLSILHMMVYMCQFYSLKSSHPLHPPLCPQVLSVCLHFCFFSVNSIFSTVFLDSIYMHKYAIFVFLFLTYFTLYNRLQVHPPHYN